MNVRQFHRLADLWRERAENYAADGGMVNGEETYKRVAEELEEAIRDFKMERLTVAEAADESGYSESHLRRLVREGGLPSADGDQRLRIRRRDLPRKPGHGTRGDVSVDRNGAVPSERGSPAPS